MIPSILAASAGVVAGITILTLEHVIHDFVDGFGHLRIVLVGLHQVLTIIKAQLGDEVRQ